MGVRPFILTILKIYCCLVWRLVKIGWEVSKNIFHFIKVNALDNNDDNNKNKTDWLRSLAQMSQQNKDNVIFPLTADDFVFQNVYILNSVYFQLSDSRFIQLERRCIVIFW